MATTNRIAKALTIEDLHMIGKDCASAIMKAEEQADKVKKTTLLKIARSYAHDDAQTKAILEGYAEQFKDAGASDSTVKARKSEFKSVFDAVAKHLVSDPKAEKLESVTGTYHDFIKACRELRDEGNTSRAPQDARIKTKLTVRQYDMVENNLEHADAVQLTDIASQAVVNIHKNVPAELAGLQSFRVIQAVCTQLLHSKNLEPVFKEAAKQIDNIAANVIERAKEAAEIASKAGQKAIPEEVK